ncbi:MAG: HutD family protein [Phreatobacter sp.]|uniref:HutD/Ves family protein n=1 Tax=Phreatobacter sp. TaxID=1966341 RepID=UPI002733EDC7|nr:HutD family protein [Phreatobacter sp.]MDP2802706.1 HutD family protein [Phreatobacter sp.]
MIRLIDPATFQAVPWKNGGGTATDIAVSLADDGEVAWRVGTAAIQKDGPFSDYAGVTRTFTIVEGPGVHLDFAGEGTRTLPRDQPTRFAGAPAPFCRLREDLPATAFNLLTGDGLASGDVMIRRGRGAEDPVPAAPVHVLLALEGDWSLTADGATVVVPQGAAAQVDGALTVSLSSPTGGRAALASIRA